MLISAAATDGPTASLPLSRFGLLFPPLESVFTRSSLTEGRYKSFEPTLQTFSIPLAQFTGANPEFRPEALGVVRLRFDRTEKGVVILDRVGFTN